MTRLLHIGRSRDPAARDDGAERSGEGAEPGPPAGTKSGTEDEQARVDSEDKPVGTMAEGRKPRADVAEPEPAADAPGAPQGESSESGGVRRRGGFVRRVVPVVCAALLVVGSGFLYGAHQLRSTSSAENHALTDAEATTRVAGDVGNALARVFSYTPNGLDTTERAARSLLAGRAERQYTELMGRIREDLAARHITLSTQAVRTGVIQLDDDGARLLVFLDQISHRGKARTTSAAAQLTVTARWEDDRWRIVDIRTR
ncbi:MULTISPECIES: hypothetical protein [unclassified Streptomyces]|uniref:hypothetical protein n=1 Tax=unclassified Streptomyces TaxID=2593676 RepID=UPI0033D3E113